MNILIPLTGAVSNNQTLTSWLVGRLASAGNLWCIIVEICWFTCFSLNSLYSFDRLSLNKSDWGSVERMQGVAKYLLDVAYSRNTRLLSLQCNLWWNTNWKTKVLDWEVWSLLVYCNLCLCKAVVWDYALLMVLKYSCVLCCLSLKQDVETLALYSHYHFKLDFFQTRDKEIFRRGLAVGKP